jgi:hypothetical protein
MPNTQLADRPRAARALTVDDLYDPGHFTTIQDWPLIDEHEDSERGDIDPHLLKLIAANSNKKNTHGDHPKIWIGHTAEGQVPENFQPEVIGFTSNHRTADLDSWMSARGLEPYGDHRQCLFADYHVTKGKEPLLKAYPSRSVERAKSENPAFNFLDGVSLLRKSPQRPMPIMYARDDGGEEGVSIVRYCRDLPSLCASCKASPRCGTCGMLDCRCVPVAAGLVPTPPDGRHSTPGTMDVDAIIQRAQYARDPGWATRVLVQRAMESVLPRRKKRKPGRGVIPFDNKAGIALQVTRYSGATCGPRGDGGKFGADNNCWQLSGGSRSHPTQSRMFPSKGKAVDVTPSAAAAAAAYPPKAVKPQPTPKPTPVPTSRTTAHEPREIAQPETRLSGEDPAQASAGRVKSMAAATAAKAQRPGASTHDKAAAKAWADEAARRQSGASGSGAASSPANGPTTVHRPAANNAMGSSAGDFPSLGTNKTVYHDPSHLAHVTSGDIEAKVRQSAKTAADEAQKALAYFHERKDFIGDDQRGQLWYETTVAQARAKRAADSLAQLERRKGSAVGSIPQTKAEAARDTAAKLRKQADELAGKTDRASVQRRMSLVNAIAHFEREARKGDQPANLTMAGTAPAFTTNTVASSGHAARGGMMSQAPAPPSVSPPRVESPTVQPHGVQQPKPARTVAVQQPRVAATQPLRGESSNRSAQTESQYQPAGSVSRTETSPRPPASPPGPSFSQLKAQAAAAENAANRLYAEAQAADKKAKADWYRPGKHRGAVAAKNDAKLKRAAAIRAEQTARDLHKKALSTPTASRPSPAEQAAEHRATKGTPAERLKAMLSRTQKRSLGAYLDDTPDTLFGGFNRGQGGKDAYLSDPAESRRARLNKRKASLDKRIKAANPASEPMAPQPAPDEARNVITIDPKAYDDVIRSVHDWAGAKGYYSRDRVA